MTALSKDILWLKDVTKDDAHSVGSRGAKTGEMIQAGFPLSDGFIVSSSAYFRFLHDNQLIRKISSLLETINYEQPDSILQVATHIKKLIIETTISDTFIKELTSAYTRLGGTFTDQKVTLFSTDSSQMSTNVFGEANLILKIKQAWASLFEPQQLLDCHTKNIDNFQNGTAVVIQKTVIPEKSGLLLSIDPLSHAQTKLIIEVFGDNTDHYVIDKTSAEPKVLEKTITSNQEKLTDTEITDLSLLGKKLEKYCYFPQEIHWAIENTRIVILQTKPLSTHPPTNTSPLGTTLPPLLKTLPLSRGIASGAIKIINAEHDFEKVLFGDILIINQPNSINKFAMKKAAAFIMQNGGRTSHAALFAREFGIPAVIATNYSSLNLKRGQIITVDGTQGILYKGSPHNLNHVAGTTATQILATLSDSSQAQQISEDHTNGVGPLLAEQMLIDKKTARELAEVLAHVCKAFQSQPIVYRTHDAQSTGTNPLLGFRGALQYLHNPKLFALELEALQYARAKLDCKNLWVMLPFVRSVKELVAIKHLMANAGLTRTNTFKLWLSISVPSNVILLDEFIATGLDGISINLDELAMLILGVDGKNSEVAHAYDVLDESILWAIERTITNATKAGITTSIYGNSLSHHPSLIEKLVKWGITSISVSPEIIDTTRERISQAERKLILDTEY